MCGCGHTRAKARADFLARDLRARIKVVKLYLKDIT